MGMDIYDYAMIVVVIFAVVLFVVFNTDVMGKSVTMNNNYSASYLSEKINESICTDVDCSSLNKTINSMVKTSTSTTTSSTIKIYFFNTSGAISSLVSSRYGGSLIDCGNNMGVMNNIFLSGYDSLNYVLITRLDESHAGACSRILMDVPFKKVIDSGGSVNGAWFSNYNFITGNSRIKYPEKGFNIGDVTVFSIKNSDTYNRLVLKIGNTIFGFLGNCDDFAFENVSRYDVLVCDKPISESVMLTSKARFVVVGNSTSDFDSLAAKYGVTVLDVNSASTLALSTDGVKINIDTKKGL